MHYLKARAAGEGKPVRNHAIDDGKVLRARIDKAAAELESLDGAACARPDGHHAGHDASLSLRSQNKHARVIRAQGEARIVPGLEQDHVPRPEVVRIENRLDARPGGHGEDTVRLLGHGPQVDLGQARCFVAPGDRRQAGLIDGKRKAVEPALGGIDAACARVSGELIHEGRAVPGLYIDGCRAVGLIQVALVDPGKIKPAAGRGETGRYGHARGIAHPGAARRAGPCLAPRRTVILFGVDLLDAARLIAPGHEEKSLGIGRRNLEVVARVGGDAARTGGPADPRPCGAVKHLHIDVAQVAATRCPRHGYLRTVRGKAEIEDSAVSLGNNRS